LADGLHSRK